MTKVALLLSYFYDLQWWSGQDIEPRPPAREPCAEPQTRSHIHSLTQTTPMT